MKRHYREPITPKQRSVLNQGAPESRERKQVLATIDQENPQAKADAQSRRQNLAEWEEELQRIEDKQPSWLKLRFEETEKNAPGRATVGFDGGTEEISI